MRKITDKRGQLSIGDAPQVVLIVGLIFLVMATIAFIGEQYGGSIAGEYDNVSHAAQESSAYNTTQDLQTEISDNTSIAGIVLTISLVGIVLTVLIGIFVGFRARRI